MGPPPQWQFNAVGFVPMATGHLSALGSVLVLCAGLKNWHKPHMRLLAIMSCYDILYSLGKAWSILFSPPESGWDMARGNMASCRAQGLFIQLSHSTGAYNALLSMYYWLTICKGMKEETWLKYERYLHGGIFVLFTTLGAIGVAIKLYNPILAFCFVNSYPPGCEGSPKSPPCERFPPAQANLLHEVFGQFWIQSFMIIVVVTNFLIWRKVHERNHIMDKYSEEKKQKRRGSRFSSPPVSTDASGELNAGEDAASNHQKKDTPRSFLASVRDRFSHSHDHLEEQSRRIQRERAVAIQCLLFTLAFLLSYIGPTFFHLYKWITGVKKFSFILILSIFTPLQGFWNAFIYARPIYPKVKSKYPELYWYQVIWQIFVAHDPLVHSEIEESRRSLRLQQQQSQQQENSELSKDFHPSSDQRRPPTTSTKRASFSQQLAQTYSSSLDNVQEEAEEGDEEQTAQLDQTDGTQNASEEGGSAVEAPSAQKLPHDNDDRDEGNNQPGQSQEHGGSTGETTATESAGDEDIEDEAEQERFEQE